MESSRRDLFIDLVVDSFTFFLKIVNETLINNQITLVPCITFIPKTIVELPKTGVSFYCETEFLIATYVRYENPAVGSGLRRFGTKTLGLQVCIQNFSLLTSHVRVGSRPIACRKAGALCARGGQAQIIRLHQTKSHAR